MEVLDVIARLLSLLNTLKTLKPFPENGLIELKADKFEFGVGERASFVAKVLKSLSNPDLEYHVQIEVNGQPVRTIKSSAIWRATSTNLSGGLHRVVGRVFVQNARVAKSLTEAIRYHENRILDLRRKLEGEHDPDVIQLIKEQIAESNSVIEDSRARLISERKPVGGEIELLISAN